MRHRWKYGPFLRSAAFLAALLALVAAAAVGLIYYVFFIPEPEGLSQAAWPARFTDNFSLWMEAEDGSLRVEEIGLARLDEYGLWLQVVDERGEEVFSRNKPDHVPVRYTASELLTAAAGGYEDGYTVFAGTFSEGDDAWSYLIGFPYAIGKYTLYYNGETVSRLSPVARGVILLCLTAFVAAVLGYGFWLSRRLAAVTEGIARVSRRTYEPKKETGVFGDAYAALNQMDREVRRGDRLQAETDQARGEWIANITHDLKTPLSPIKGYAELLADHPETAGENAQAYGTVILKNVGHVEKLMDDLKLTYQLDAGAIPCHPQPVRLVRYVRELVIDLVNDPAFADRPVSFVSDGAESAAMLDPDLFRRALQNILVNALTHNPPDTEVTMSVGTGKDGGAVIAVRDNGVGMSEAERTKLFDRYYRGTNTQEKPEGSGLGLAIAQQIIQLHGGTVAVESQPGQGTEITITLPPAANSERKK